MDVRPYVHSRDRESLWELKHAFERELGSTTGGADKATAYERKLTPAYRERYFDWVDRCLAENDECILVGIADEAPSGYVFVLPESLGMIWDAAVINELFVRARYRGTGLADQLMSAAIERAREQSLPMDRLVLDVSRENERARAFYARHGFEEWSGMVARPL